MTCEGYGHRMSESPSISRVALKKITPDVSAAMGSLHAAAVSAAQDAKLEPELLELVRIRASQINGCAFCLDMHTRDARAQGETEQRLYTLNAWRETPFFTERERAALALTEAVTLVHDGRVPDAVYAEAAEVFDENQIAALIWSATVINAYNRIAIATRMVPKN
ncbi:alkylhydroperoxidase AhpD [Streptomyces viridochromogenes DSM 40736]|uniref:Alkylhydroperoxidase AhpD n=2 Tax=Streptomyces viridochromogenes TaxID=1938 RepID=D9XB49_STRVT|nr:alkylhydroperoxidase AhpD [Streptomyces viridochromogenes DSM 40736]